MLSHSHLAAIDSTVWPGLTSVPGGWRVESKARRAERAFAKACAKAGIELDPASGAQVVVDYATVFARIAESGWVGLAEGFMAGEWSVENTDTLVDALEALLGRGYNPRSTVKTVAAESGDIPPELVHHFSEDGMSAFAGFFSTGVATTERTMMKSHVPGAGRKGQPTSRFVDITTVDAPQDAERGDLSPAQGRAVEMLLDATRVTSGSHVVEFPSSGGLVAVAAAARRATVHSIASDDAAAHALEERLVFAGVRDAVHIEVDGPQVKRGGFFDAAISVEKLETLPEASKAAYLGALGRLIQPGGRIAVQTVMRTAAYTAAADGALESLRAYIWPGLSFSLPEEITRSVDKQTNLRVLSRTHAPEHLTASLRLQRHRFDARLREAAADGFDPVYRRLWQWQFAVREALARLGMIDLVQLTLVPRDRRGLR
ncbi:SAM-dependent methyltransferase [Corynebacterium mayonis]|uniref:SAM-dependent methyltransferase n=1 Tax=Corynebacterium mayonis TaxID=3062461 RepID=UPI00314083FC